MALETEATIFGSWHPICQIDNLAAYLWKKIESRNLTIDHDFLACMTYIYDLVAILVLIKAFHWLSFFGFIPLALFIGLCKQVLNRAKDATTGYKEPQNKLKEDTATTSKNLTTWKLDADKVEEYCRTNAKPSLEWLNLILKTFWLNLRAQVRHLFLTEIWPQVAAKLANTPLSTVDAQDFNIGDKPVTVVSITAASRELDSLVLDVELAYDGNASVTITITEDNITNIAVPFTLKKFKLSHLRARLVIRPLLSTFPFVGGVQVSLLETPLLDWEMAGAATFVNVDLFKKTVLKVVDDMVLYRFVAPNRLNLVLDLFEPEHELFAKFGFSHTKVTDESVAMPRPQGVLRVTVVEARGLRATDLGFQHLGKVGNHLNPFRPSQFSISEVLPKKTTSDPYAVVTLGGFNHTSEVEHNTLEPVWNFECEFPVEYIQGAVVKVSLLDRDEIVGGLSKSDDLGRIHQKVSEVIRCPGGKTEGWYNCETYQGRAHIKFEWITQTVLRSGLDDERLWQEHPSGLLSLLLGTLTVAEDNDFEIRPQIFVIFDEYGQDKKEEMPTLESMASSRRHVINEGRIFRIKNLKNHSSTYLTILVKDCNKNKKVISALKFPLKRLIEHPLHGERFIGKHTMKMSIFTKIMIDETKEETQS